MSKNKKNKKSKTPKYIPTSEYIGIDTGFIQASTLLDIASIQAVQSGDHNAMARLAREWLDLSRVMKETLVNSDDEEGHPDEDDDEPSTARVSSPVGFGTTIKEIKDFHDRASQN